MRSHRSVQGTREMRPKSLMAENCPRPNGLHTQTDGSGLGMRSYCRIKSQIGDRAMIVLSKHPPGRAMTLGNMRELGVRTPVDPTSRHARLFGPQGGWLGHPMCRRDRP